MRNCRNGQDKKLGSRGRRSLSRVRQFRPVQRKAFLSKLLGRLGRFSNRQLGRGAVSGIRWQLRWRKAPREQRVRRLADRWYAGYSGEYWAAGDVNRSGRRIRTIPTTRCWRQTISIQRITCGLTNSMLQNRRGRFPTTGDRTVRAGLFRSPHEFMDWAKQSGSLFPYLLLYRLCLPSLPRLSLSWCKLS